jgi:hypothetical protein
MDSKTRFFAITCTLCMIDPKPSIGEGEPMGVHLAKIVRQAVTRFCVSFVSFGCSSRNTHHMLKFEQASPTFLLKA